MPTKFYRSQAMGDPIHYTVTESVEEVTDAVNAALSSNLKFVYFTKAEDGKQFSVEAKAVGGIQEV